jgi:PAS domain S-box-containing protein
MAILEAVPDAMVITDDSGVIVFINKQTEKMFGYARDELLGKELESLMPERFKKSHRNHRSGYFSKPKTRPMGTGLALFGMKKDGTEFPVDISLSPFQTGAGMLSAASIRDVSELRHVTDNLHRKIKELADFKSALDEHAILAITDPGGIITYVNDKFCRISKYPREELLGQDHRIINSGHHPKKFWREAWATIGRGKVWKGEVRNRAKDGSFYWVDATIVPFLDEHGKPVQYVAIRTEITARKKAEEEREKLIEELKAALGEVKILSGLLPICCNCKKVRDDKGYWNQIENYISKHSDAFFSHGYCPDCIGQVYEEAGLPVPEKFQRKQRRLRTS